MTADDGERLLTTGETAAALGVTDTTVKRWMRTGKTTSVVTPGGRRRFRPDDVERRLAVDQDRPIAPRPRSRSVHAAPNRGTDRRLLGSTQVAAMLDVDPKTVSRWSDQGHLPAAATTVSGHRRWRPDDVQRFADKHGLAPERAT